MTFLSQIFWLGRSACERGGATLGLVLLAGACGGTVDPFTAQSDDAGCGASTCGVCGPGCTAHESCVAGRWECSCRCPDAGDGSDASEKADSDLREGGQDSTTPACGPNPCGACPPGCTAMDSCLSGTWDCRCECSDGGRVECETADDCEVVESCCACVAPRGVDLNCPENCEVYACDALGITGAVTPACRNGVCVPEVDCDPRNVACAMPAPACNPGPPERYPFVSQGCWGPGCVDAALCRLLPPGPSDPGVVMCNGEACLTHADHAYCCVLESYEPGELACRVAQACPDGFSRFCDEAADCPAGDSCYAALNSAPFFVYNHTYCSAAPDAFDIQICRTHVECPEGQCVTQTCSGETVQSCGGIDAENCSPR